MKNGGNTEHYSTDDLYRKSEMTCTQFRPFRRCIYHTVKHYEAWKPSKYLKTASYLTENTLHVHYTDIKVKQSRYRPGVTRRFPGS